MPPGTGARAGTSPKFHGPIGTISLMALEKGRIGGSVFWLQPEELKSASLDWGEFGELLEGAARRIGGNPADIAAARGQFLQ